MNVRIRPATTADYDDARRLLCAAGLPTADFLASFLAHAAERDGRLVGIIGLQLFETAALLRSLVVTDAARGEGVAERLVAALETTCAEQGVRQVWLLTIDADGYFAKRGYNVVERNAAPADIRRTDEFSALCPADAVLMQKNL